MIIVIPITSFAHVSHKYHLSPSDIKSYVRNNTYVVLFKHFSQKELGRWPLGIYDLIGTRDSNLELQKAKSLFDRLYNEDATNSCNTYNVFP